MFLLYLTLTTITYDFVISLPWVTYHFYFCFILLFLIEHTFNIGCLYQINGRNWIKSLQLYYI